MFKLPMAAGRSDKKPAIGPKHDQYIAYFHGARIAKLIEKAQHSSQSALRGFFG
ncbi:MAG: hypothetical protein ACOYNV_14055 [Propionivibrio sp.]